MNAIHYLLKPVSHKHLKEAIDRLEGKYPISEPDTPINYKYTDRLLVTSGNSLCFLKITFEFVWKKVNDTFYDLTFGGFNWKDAHDRYLPQIAVIEKDDDFYRLVNKMLWELKVSHTNLIRPGNLAPQISNAIKSMGNVPVIIFDLHGNAGGEIEEMPTQPRGSFGIGYDDIP